MLHKEGLEGHAAFEARTQNMNVHCFAVVCQASPDAPDLGEKLAEKEQELERTRQQLQRYAPAEQVPQ